MMEIESDKAYIDELAQLETFRQTGRVRWLKCDPHQMKLQMEWVGSNGSVRWQNVPIVTEDEVSQP